MRLSLAEVWAAICLLLGRARVSWRTTVTGCGDVASARGPGLGCVAVGCRRGFGGVRSRWRMESVETMRAARLYPLRPASSDRSNGAGCRAWDHIHVEL